MKRLVVIDCVAFLIVGLASSLARGGFITFTGLDRAAVLSTTGQSFPWNHEGLSGTVTVRPAGATAALTTDTPLAFSGQATDSVFYTGVVTRGGPAGAYFEFLFDIPINLTVFNAESLFWPERVTLQTNGTGWVGGWYSGSGTLSGINTQSVALSYSLQTPPFPYAALSSREVTKLVFLNEVFQPQGFSGVNGNGIEIRIDAVVVPEPHSVLVAAVTAAVLICCWAIGNRQQRQARRAFVPIAESLTR